ncbi:shikimate kinase [Fulvivirgaceae bacterium PWU20]|uniref:Shikimate kinase n=2 Tax=Chryseosolibacter indicus TaxID=2782351 RepID=A0ABS5VTX3_9BACT|nr:shikimate kinase [Chryseosolibacter indicus]
MPGSGKTTSGRKLSEALQLEFVDLDEEICKTEGQTIPDIFRLRGEDYFRQVESEVLRGVASKNGARVIATGGGAPCFHDGIDIINNAGTSIFLDVPISVLLQRVKYKTGRPLLDANLEEAEKKLSQLYQARLPIYNKAKIRIQNPDLNVLLAKIKNTIIK